MKLREKIGIVNFAEPEKLKKWALFFDVLAITPFASFQYVVSSSDEEEQKKIDQLKWLGKKEIVQAVTFENVPAYEILDSNMPKSLLELRRDEDKLLESLSNSLKDHPYKDKQDIFSTHNRSFIPTYTRRVSEQLRTLHDIDAYPIVPETIFSLDQPIENKSDIIHIIIKNFPFVIETEPWEKIIEFRSDDSNKEKYLRLQIWMRNIINKKLTVNETVDELDWLLHEYESNLKLHKLKIRTGTIETLLKSTAATIEGIAKLELSKAVEGLFSIKHQKIELLESELSAPGREIAYLSEVRNEFQ